jgi:hypothetical protein
MPTAVPKNLQGWWDEDNRFLTGRVPSYTPLPDGSNDLEKVKGSTQAA